MHGLLRQGSVMGLTVLRILSLFDKERTLLSCVCVLFVAQAVNSPMFSVMANTLISNKWSVGSLCSFSLLLCLE